MGNRLFWYSVSKALAVVAVTLLLRSGVWAANAEKVLYTFTGGNDGGRPAADLVLDTAGNLYGTTVVGGDLGACPTVGCGTVFKLTPVAGGKWKETVLYNFVAGTDGKNPYGGVAIDSKGNLFGTTVAGGSGGTCAGDGCGVVFMLTHSGNSWKESVLYSFTGGRDGAGPGGGLILDQKTGYLYGTAASGGKPNGCAGGNGCGVVYQLVTVKGGQWKQQVLHTFSGGRDGATGSLGRLLFDKAGNLYGAAELGGDLSCNPTSGCGVVYKLTPTSGGKWQLSTLYAFKGTPDGNSSYGGLVSDAKGNLYGTTYYGGSSNSNCLPVGGCGTVFALIKGSNGMWRESVLYRFQGGADGSNPTTTLVFDANGKLYGTTASGGDTNGDGVVFKLTPNSGGKWKESVVHGFKNNPDGANPNYGLARVKKTGTLFGVAPFGGSGQGVVFQITP
jgi:uncharacterized repeat protein (TIGR03803 family)